jgi:hypothetical protein
MSSTRIFTTDELRELPIDSLVYVVNKTGNTRRVTYARVRDNNPDYILLDGIKIFYYDYDRDLGLLESYAKDKILGVRLFKEIQDAKHYVRFKTYLEMVKTYHDDLESKLNDGVGLTPQDKQAIFTIVKIMQEG